MSASPDGIKRTEVYETEDGKRHNTMVEAEYHQSRLAVGKLLATLPYTDSAAVDSILDKLSDSDATRVLVRAWLHNCSRMARE